jgi:hypothetical protein
MTYEDLRLVAMNFALTLAASHTADGLVADAKTILVFIKGEEK